jgi:predicted permease
MIRALFHLLQWMLPPARRRRYGREMANVFETLVAEERRAQGAAGVARLLFREAAGLSRFAARDWLRRVGVRARARGIRPRVASDLHWAWRGVRARGWRVPLIVGLIGTTLGANAVVFSVADSFIFNPFPYQAPERIVSMTHSAAAPEQVVLPHSAALLSAWSTQRDLVAAAGGYLRKGGIFLLSPDSAERVFGADITVGLLDVLGVQPRWGRSFVDSDLRETGGHAALLREDLARRRFGQPDRAVGQRLDATGGPLLIVGVMSSDFAFPRADTQVWRALDPSGPLARNFEATPLLVRLRSGEPVDTASASIAARARMVGQAVGLASYGVEVQPFAVHRNPAARGAMLWVLLGAALCLVLSSCANVASLELAQVLRRARSFGVQLALGASRGSLVRVVMLEGLCIVGCALAVGLGLAWILTTLVRDLIPEAIRITSQNPIALEIRAISYAAAVAGVTWLLVAAPPIVSVWRGGVSKVLTFGGRATTESRRGATIRRALTVIQVGLAVTLAVVGLQYARSYRNLLALEKGFDTNGVALLTALVPNYYFGTNASRLAFVDRLLGALRTEPGVVAAAEGPAPPHMGDTPSRISPIVDGQPTAGEVLLGRNWIDPAYFAVTKLPLLAGRYLEPGDPPDHAVVTDVFARRFWPDVSPIGRQFSGGPGSSLPEPFTVVGVVGGFRTNPRRLPSATAARARGARRCGRQLWHPHRHGAARPSGAPGGCSRPRSELRSEAAGHGQPDRRDLCPAECRRSTDVCRRTSVQWPRVRDRDGRTLCGHRVPGCQPHA